jgi:hypothetical protein
LPKRPPKRKIDANAIISERDPKLRIELPASVQYVGADRWILYEIAGPRVSPSRPRKEDPDMGVARFFGNSTLRIRRTVSGNASSAFALAAPAFRNSSRSPAEPAINLETSFIGKERGEIGVDQNHAADLLLMLGAEERRKKSTVGMCDND